MARVLRKASDSLRAPLILYDHGAIQIYLLTYLLTFMGKRKKFIFNAFVDFKPMQRFENRGDVTEFGSLNHSGQESSE